MDSSCSSSMFGHFNESSKYYCSPQEASPPLLSSSSRQKNVLLKIFVIVICLFLFLPILVIMVRPLLSKSTESSTKPTETSYKVQQENVHKYPDQQRHPSKLLSPLLEASEEDPKHINNFKDLCYSHNGTNYPSEGVDDLYFNGKTSDSKVRDRITFQATLTNLTEPKRKKLILTLSALSDEDIRTCSNGPNTYQKYCEFTNDSKRFKGADAVIFRQQDLNILPLLLSNRTNTQMWIYNSPSPASFNTKQQIEKYKNVFNLSATYDFRSHLPMLPMYYFTTTNIPRTYIKKDVTSDIVTVAVYNKDCEEEEIFRRKYKHVLQALLEGNDLRVDWFRGCSNKSSECHDLTSAQCYQTIAPHYKFALAFETSDADFISERFFDPLKDPGAFGSMDSSCSSSMFGHFNESSKYYCSPEKVPQPLLSSSSRQKNVLIKIFFILFCLFLFSSILVILVRPLFSKSTESSTKPTETSYKVQQENAHKYPDQQRHPSKSPLLQASEEDPKHINTFKDLCHSHNGTNYPSEGVGNLYFNGNTNDSNVRERIKYQASILTLTEPKRKKLILTLSALTDEDIRTCSNSPNKYQKYCEFTNDSKRFTDADAVIFRQQDLNILSLLLSNRTNTQMWIYNSPSPASFNTKQQIEKYKNVFNLSATYDFRSHLPMLPMYFTTTNIQRTYIKKDVTSDIVTVAVYNKDCEEEEIFRRKYKHVLQALLEGNDLRVDWFRGCSNKSSECHDLTSTQCYQTIAPRYKFALAFETSDADFISERFFDPLNNTVIPIVIGNSTKAKYEALSIKGSFIFWCDFDNVKQLKNELKELNTNSTKLEEYFKWLNKGEFYSNKRWYCQVCTMLFRARTTTTVEDMTVFL